MSKKSRNILGVLSIAVFLVLLANPAQAVEAVTVNSFSLSPNPVRSNTGSTRFRMTLGVTLNFAGAGGFNEKCGGTHGSFFWYLYGRTQIGGTGERASGKTDFVRSSPSQAVNLTKDITVATIIDSSESNKQIAYFVQIYCTDSILSSVLARSSDVIVKFGSLTDKRYACVDTDNKYACSPSGLANCSDVPAVKGCPTASKPCVEIGVNLCGEPAGTGPGPGPGPGPDGGKTTTTTFEFKNPIEAENLIDLLDVIATWLFNISIPIMVAMVLYAGITFLISRGEPSKLTQAKNILLYAVIGFSIILIGKGFITLIKSILNLGTSP